jgi:predicted ATPase
MAGLIAKHFLHEVRLARDGVPSFEEYPFSLPAVRHLDRLVLHPNVTFLVRENGSGKSTLVEAIAVAFRLNAEGGSRNFNFRTRGSHSALHRHLVLARGHTRPSDCFFLRAETFYNVATHIEELDAAPGTQPPIGQAYGDRPLHEQSHGESFFALFRERFRGHGLYLLDEPEAALSPMRQMALLRIIDGLVTDCSQFVIATHSPIVLAYPRAWIYELGPNGAERVPYEKTEQFSVYRDFLNRYPLMVRSLLKPDEGE